MYLDLSNDFKEIYDSYAYNDEESRHNCQYYEISEMYKTAFDSFFIQLIHV